MTNELPAPFVGASDTSRARAQHEDATGVTAKRRQHITDILAHRGPYGATWKELADITGLHHGQVSGVLSKLHESGRLFQQRDTRNGCHPYVHADFRHEFKDDEVNDEPVQTRANRRVTLLNGLQEAAHDLCYGRGDMGQKWDRMRQQLKLLEELGK
jgi:hypothetical protein